MFQRPRRAVTGTDTTGKKEIPFIQPTDCTYPYHLIAKGDANHAGILIHFGIVSVFSTVVRKNTTKKEGRYSDVRRKKKRVVVKPK